MAQIHAQVGHRLLIPVLQRAERLQDVELRSASVHAGDAVATLAVARFSGLNLIAAIPKLVWLV